MARPRKQSDTERSPHTCCSSCQTVFEVAPALLASTDTRVRCGECLSIFDALSNLCAPDTTEPAVAIASNSDERDSAKQGRGRTSHRESGGLDAEQAALAGLANDTAALDVTYSDFDLFSGDAELPEVAYFDQTRDTPEFDFDAVEHDDDETFSDTLFSMDVTVDARSGLREPDPSAGTPPDSGHLHHTRAAIEEQAGFITDQNEKAPLKFTYRDPDDAPVAAAGAEHGVSAVDAPLLAGGAGEHTISVPEVKRQSPWGFRFLMLLLVGVLAAGLYGYRERNRLHLYPQTRPAMLAVCGVIGCEVPPQVDLSALRATRKVSFSHPELADALVINLGFRNTASFDQPYPVLLVKLTTQTGALVARRMVPPLQYVDGWQAGDIMEAGKSIDVSLEVMDPGGRASSVDFEVLSARPDASIGAELD